MGTPCLFPNINNEATSSIPRRSSQVEFRARIESPHLSQPQGGQPRVQRPNAGGEGAVGEGRRTKWSPGKSMKQSKQGLVTTNLWNGKPTNPTKHELKCFLQFQLTYGIGVHHLIHRPMGGRDECSFFTPWYLLGTLLGGHGWCLVRRSPAQTIRWWLTWSHFLLQRVTCKTGRTGRRVNARPGLSLVFSSLYTAWDHHGSEKPPIRVVEEQDITGAMFHETRMIPGRTRMSTSCTVYCI